MSLLKNIIWGRNKINFLQESSTLYTATVKFYASRAKRYVIAGGPDLHVAIRSGNKEAVNELIQQQDMDINQVDKRPTVGMGSPLHVAVFYNRLHVATQLLENNADPTSYDRNGRTPLHLCGQSGNVQMASLLLQSGVDADMKSANSPTTPLHLAIRNKHTPLVHELIMKGANPSSLDGRGSSAIHAAILSYDTQLLRVLLRSPKANLTVRDSKGKCPLALAAIAKDEAAVEMLLEFGCDVNQKDSYGRTALHIAAATLRRKMVALLCQNGADVNCQDTKKGWTALHMMILHKVMQGFVDSQASSRLQIIDTLIQHGADINIPDLNGNTALHLVAKTDLRNVLLKKLLQNGAKQQVPNSKGQYPLKIAQLHSAMQNVLLFKKFYNSDDSSLSSTHKNQEQLQGSLMQ